jgi:hypothetical protein
VIPMAPMAPMAMTSHTAKAFIQAVYRKSAKVTPRFTHDCESRVAVLNRGQ